VETVTRLREPVSVPPSLPPPLPIGSIRLGDYEGGAPSEEFWKQTLDRRRDSSISHHGRLGWVGGFTTLSALFREGTNTDCGQKCDRGDGHSCQNRKIRKTHRFAGTGHFRPEWVDPVYHTGFLDGDGKVDMRAFDRQWKFVTPFYDNLFNVQKDNKWGMINDSGEIVHQPQWDDEPFLHDRTVLNYSGDFAFIQRAGKFGFINKSGKVISQPQWEDCNRFTEGLAVVKRNGKYGYIETSGAVVIDLAWSSAGTFSNGLAPVSRDNKWGYIDKKGTLAIPLEWTNAFHLRNSWRR
jgi:hypothetical protein